MKYSRLFMTLSILLAVLLLALWLLPGRPHHWRTWQTPKPQPPELQDALATLLAPNPVAGATYPETVERPLFAANRRPMATVDSPPPKPITPIDQARLLGVIIGMGVNGVMIDYDGKSRFVRKGEDVGGWRLTDMHERTAIFEREGQKRDLMLPLVNPAAAANIAPPKNPVPASSTLADRLTGGGAAPTAPALQPSAAPSAPIPTPTFSGSRRGPAPAGVPPPATNNPR